MIETRSAMTLLLSFLFALLSLGSVTVQAQTSRPDLDFKRERQKQVQVDTDRTVRRVGTMLRVLDYYQLDKRSERQLLDEVAGTLASLSQAQMNEVIARLEAAAKAADEKHSENETEGAYTRHREIVAQLKKLLARYDAIKGLDQAAKRLEEMAKKQHELSLRGSQMAHDWRNTSTIHGPQGLKAHKGLHRELRHAVDDQEELKKDTTSILAQIAKLRPQLPREQQQRLNQAEDLVRKHRLLDRMTLAADALIASIDNPVEKLQSSVASQRQAAENLQELAHILRTPLDRLAALREARDRVASILQNQEGLRHQAENATLQPRSKQQVPQARKMGDHQGRLELASRSARNLLAPQDQDLGKRIVPAEKAMRQAEDTLRKNALAQAARPQSEALRTLRAVHNDLVRRIAEAERERGDPLVALQKATEQVDRLIQEQKDLRDKAAEATTTNKPMRLPAMTSKQQNLAHRTTQLSQEASPVQTALAKAAEAMVRASKNLHDQKGKESVARQDEAIRNLEKAHEALAQQAAAIARRRQEIAALETAAERLDHLVNDQGKLTAAAQERAQKNESPDTKDLAKQQETLASEAKKVGKQVERAAAEAGKKVDESSVNMEAAQRNLDSNKAKPGAREAQAATDKLKAAQKALARALDEKRGADLAEQAGMQPADVDAVNAADQIAKALVQTKEAAAQSEKAADMLGSRSKAPDLAKLQQQVAEHSETVQSHEARKPAADAAQALQKGDLTAAIAQQKKALATLEQNTNKKGEVKEEISRNENPDPAQAKNAAKLAQLQKGLLKATQALARSQEATQEAMTALSQAHAQAPRGVQGELQRADAELNQAEQQLHQVAPTPANRSQQAAAAQLSKALQAMNAALAAMGQHPRSQPGQGQAMARGQKPGQSKGQGQGKGQGRGQSMARGPAQERNGTKGNGNRMADGKMSNAPPQLNDVAGDGSFLHLPPRQRDMIRQALTSKLPAQYAAMIQQYFVNIASGKPASAKSEMRNPQSERKAK